MTEKQKKTVEFAKSLTNFKSVEVEEPENSKFVFIHYYFKDDHCSLISSHQKIDENGICVANSFKRKDGRVTYYE